MVYIGINLNTDLYHFTTQKGLNDFDIQLKANSLIKTYRNKFFKRYFALKALILGKFY